MAEQPAQTGPTASDLRSRILWPGMVFALLGSQVLLMLVMAYMATMDPSFAVEPDYYQKALHWDDKRAQDRANTELGWQLEFTVEPAAAGQDPTLRVELTSADGEPVTDATVAVEAFSNVRRDDVLTAILAATESGYASTLPMHGDGRWEFRFHVTRDSDLYTYRETRHIWTEIPD